ncbi:VapA/VapB family virulence-associated protein [Gilvimarinus sp. DA14]|uniref:VapA/VapB family virulence-associated protein n=1 Tax=Gilvimarinus sp. DA14 TaxID=2956798 RepID=UPI0020B6CC35|nr:VapA/VapB family virulence-associated protein [Gilvimarinus sp. DA14]UTF60846.1 VapA/VapB family virulence-associated protein [Gilvimarinus sp. DA14]
MTAINEQPIRLATDFAKHCKGMLDASALSRAVQLLESTTENRLRTQTPLDAEGSLSSLIYYIKVRCCVAGGRCFSGRVWGQGLANSGTLCGDLYPAEGCSLDDVYCRTCEFTYTATPAYTAVYFFDFNELLLGHFQAGAVDKVYSAGKGEGGWR